MIAVHTAGGVVLFTGRPASGKSTLAHRVARQLREEGLPTVTLDGDAVRAALVPTPGYTPEERADFYATLTNLGATLAYQGLWVLIPATYPRAADRQRLRQLAPRTVEVFVAASLEECEARDEKGLYRRAREGNAPHLPGIGVPYELPHMPDVAASGGDDTRALERVLTLVREHAFAAALHEAL